MTYAPFPKVKTIYATEINKNANGKSHLKNSVKNIRVYKTTIKKRLNIPLLFLTVV